MNEEFLKVLQYLKRRYEAFSVLRIVMQIMAWNRLSTEEGESLNIPSPRDFFYTSVSFEKLTTVFKKISLSHPRSFSFVEKIDDSDIVSLLSALIESDFAIPFEELYSFLFFDRLSRFKTNRPIISYKLGFENFVSQLLGSFLKDDSSVYFSFTDIVIPSLLPVSRGKYGMEDTINHDWVVDLYNIIYSARLDYRKSNPLINPAFYNRSAPHLLEEFDYGIVDTFSFMIKESGNLKDYRANVDKYNRFRASGIHRSTYVNLIEHGLKQVRNALIVIVPELFLSKTLSVEREIKKYWCGHNLLESVICLSKNIFSTSFWRIGVIVLNKRKEDETVFMVDGAAEIFYKVADRKKLLFPDKLLSLVSEKKARDGISKVFSFEDVKRRNYDLNPAKYPLSSEEEKFEKIFLNIGEYDLKDIADFIRPIHIPIAKTDNFYTLREVGTDNIPPVGYISDFEEKIVDTTRMINPKQFLLPHDILLALRGNVGTVGLMPESVEEKYIAIQSLQIIRLRRRDIDPRGLYMYLKTDIVRKWLEKSSAGGVLPRIGLNDLLNIPVPINKMDYFSGLFDREISLYREKEKIEREIEGLRKFPITTEK